MKLENFKEREISINLSKEDYAIVKDCLPNAFVPKECSFELHNTNIAMANAIRIIIFSHIECKLFDLEMSDVKTSSNYILENVIYAIKNIPINQDIPDGSKFRLEAENKTETFMAVKSGHIKAANDDAKRVNAEKAFDKNIELFFIESGTSFYADITVIKKYGRDDAKAKLAQSCVSIPLDVEPYDEKTGKGVHATMAEPSKFRIQFRTAGNIDSKKIIKKAEKELKAKMNNLIRSVKNTESFQSFVIEGEDDALGGLITHYMIKQSINCTYDYDHINRKLIMRFSGLNSPAEAFIGLNNMISKIHFH